MPKIIRITTVPLSLKLLLSGQMKFMYEAGWEVVMVSSEGKELAEVIKKEGVRHQVIPFTREITPIQDLLCLIKLYSFFKSERPDIVHSHTPKAGFLSMLAAKLAGVKIRIHTLAGMPSMSAVKHKRTFLNSLEKLTFNLATEVWANSLSLRDFVISENLVNADKIKVIASGSSNGVDLQKFTRGVLVENHLVAATMRIKPGENDFVILAVGRLVKDKGIEELVRAFTQSKIVNQSKLVLLGTFEQKLNPLDLQVIRMIQDHPRIVHVEWTDFVPYYMALSDVLVHASHREGFPNVLLEAGAMELPIICSDIIGNNDVVINKKTGLLFPVKHIDFLKDALEFAFIKRDYMQSLAHQLKVEVEMKYERSLVHQNIIKNYYRLIDRK
jgi:glycosyltransferase involved in cell wall biosynthesis